MSGNAVTSGTISVVSPVTLQIFLEISDCQQVNCFESFIQSFNLGKQSISVHPPKRWIKPTANFDIAGYSLFVQGRSEFRCFRNYRNHSDPKHHPRYSSKRYTFASYVSRT